MIPRTVVPLDRLRSNSDQARRVFDRIPELAESIARDGLVQSLVVEPADADGNHEIIAGERRYRALLLLAEQGRLQSRDVPCFIKSAEPVLADIMDIWLHDTPLWELGRTYINLSESGKTQIEIAGEVQKSPSHVSRAMQLARGLAPAVIARLSKLPPDTLPAQRLLRVAALHDEHGEPDEPNQLRLFLTMLDAPERKSELSERARAEKDNVWERYQQLKQGKLDRRVDPVYRPFLDAVLKYLSGENAGLTG
ncbi:MAG: ParB/RepB/Spo0J family partition protein [Myxococcota bacterium]